MRGLQFVLDIFAVLPDDETQLSLTQIVSYLNAMSSISSRMFHFAWGFTS
jgi:hypothetical protein